MIKWTLSLIAAAVVSAGGAAFAQDPPTPEWIEKIRKLAPEKPTAPPKAKRKVLLFWLHTGFDHKVIPSVNEVFKVLAEKSKAFELTLTLDIEMFAPEKLAAFDAVVLNNNCSQGPGRNMFLDVLSGNIKGQHKALGDKYKGLGDKERKAKAATLEKSLLDYVAGGKGIVGVHGAVVLINKSEGFNAMLGASFAYHPKLQELTLHPVEPAHPLLKAFDGKTFVHTDECYVMTGVYAKKDFRPLLYVESKKVKGIRKGADEKIYMAWIRKHGKGRVFYAVPSHVPGSYENTSLLRFYLDGVQYATGDLACDDSVVKP